MGCYHFHLNQLSRGKGQSAIASAAYRAGTKLECTYYGEVSDYTRKGGVVLAEIHLPQQAPERFKDRETLWNEVEWIEGNKKAQLAHSFDIALMNEFSMEENIELARRFVEEQLVARGMIADLAIHDPKKAKDKIPNPHMHIMVPIRPLQEDGTSINTGWTAGSESERTTGISGGTYNGLEQERNLGRMEKCLGEDVQRTV